MNTFKTKFKGYDKTQVDEYIVGLSSQFEHTRNDLMMRIKQLESENENLYNKLCEYREKEQSISTAILNAIDKAKEIDYASKVRFALEGERLNEFSKKWTAFCKNQANKVSQKNVNLTNSFINEMKNSLQELLGEQLNLDNYINEAIIQHSNEEDRLKSLVS